MLLFISSNIAIEEAQIRNGGVMVELLKHRFRESLDLLERGDDGPFSTHKNLSTEELCTVGRAGVRIDNVVLVAATEHRGAHYTINTTLFSYVNIFLILIALSLECDKASIEVSILVSFCSIFEAKSLGCRFFV